MGGRRDPAREATQTEAPRQPLAVVLAPNRGLGSCRQTAGTVKARRRQANGPLVRLPGLHVTAEQACRWRSLAATDQITLPRWIVERLENKTPAPVRRAIITELSCIRYEIRGAMANLNQLAHRANMADLDLEGWSETVAAIERQTELLDAAIGQLVK